MLTLNPHRGFFRQVEGESINRVVTSYAVSVILCSTLQNMGYIDQLRT